MSPTLASPYPPVLVRADEAEHLDLIGHVLLADSSATAVVRRLDGSEPPEMLLGLQDRFDTHFLDSPAWQRARAAD
jgi:hypothetical protein